MVDETPRTEPTAETPQVVAPTESVANGTTTDALQKDVTMSDAPVDHPAVCSPPSICSSRFFVYLALITWARFFNLLSLVSGVIQRTDY
jgi:hypothetical protein